ncbi:hypothetical protein [Vibrio sp. WXL210]|uniref:hypothetical protein n=1 Tax=Vibrio sp. WXL210 TaxID=3450709 RepID=UPI003EC78D69
MQELENVSGLPVGSYFKARITRIEKLLQAAFVDYGAERHGFMPIDDALLSSLKEGMEVTVRLDKKETGNKGAAVSYVTDNSNLTNVYRSIPEVGSDAPASSIVPLKFILLVLVIGLAAYVGLVVD